MANQERTVYGYFEKRGNTLCYRYESERIVIEPWGSNSLRVRASKLAEMPQENWALLVPQAECEPVIEIDPDGAMIWKGKK